MSVEFVSTMSLESFVSYVPERFMRIYLPFSFFLFRFSLSVSLAFF